MDFGLVMLGDVQQPIGTDMVRRFDELVERVRLARELGFHAVAAGQHYVTSPFQMLQGIPVLSRLSGEIPGVELLANLILPFHNPVDLAEQTATLDIMSKGRLRINAAMGYREEEFHAFQLARQERMGRFVECLELLKRFWIEESVTYHGKYFEYEDVRVTLKPVQKPLIPITIAANADAAVQRAARLGHPWYINPHATMETIKRQVNLYRQAAEEAGNPVPLHVIGRQLWVAEDRDQAWKEVAAYLGRKFDVYAQWGQDKALPGQESFRVPFDELAHDRFIIGSPQDCIDEIHRCEEFGIQRMFVPLRWPGMPVDLSVKGLRIFADTVMPHFH